MAKGSETPLGKLPRRARTYTGQFPTLPLELERQSIGKSPSWHVPVLLPLTASRHYERLVFVTYSTFPFAALQRFTAFVLRVTTPVLLATSTFGQTEPSPSNPSSLALLSLEELMNLEVSTLSRKSEQWWRAPGAIDVVTGDDIRRSGVSTLQDALRLATGVQVTRPENQSWGIGIRGFALPGGNKINVQLDGRTLFTPFYSGVFWETQNTVLEDIDRIEVVRGPVGAAWGSFALNGFIQILSKPAWETQGPLTSVTVGSEDEHIVVTRYGDQIGQNTFYRAYAKYQQFEPLFQLGKQATAVTDFAQAGFRADRRNGPDTLLTLQGDVYTNKGLFRDGDRTHYSGGNLMGKWQRTFSIDRDLQVSSYYDFTKLDFPRDNNGEVLGETRHVVQASIKYRHAWSRNEFQLGSDNFVSWDKIRKTTAIQFDPLERTIETTSVFVSHKYELVEDVLAATVGGKFEHNDFTGFEHQPTARVAYTPDVRTTLWSAVSRAVRTPVRLDHDINFPPIFYANDEFRSETVTAYELGARRQLWGALAADVAWFYNDYEDLRSYQQITPEIIPWTFANMLNAKGHGVELTVHYQPLPKLSFKGSYRYLDLDFSFDPERRSVVDQVYEANDAKHLATGMVRYDLNRQLQLDVTLRYMDDLPKPATEGFLTADLRLGWTPRAHWDLSLIGRNLAHRYRTESIIPQNQSGVGQEVARSFALRVTWAH